MKRSLKIYAAGFLAFSLGFAASLGFMTASFPLPETAEVSGMVVSAGTAETLPVLVSMPAMEVLMGVHRRQTEPRKRISIWQLHRIWRR